MKSPPPKLCFGRIIYIDCSRWESKRAMQRKIAQELKLDQKTMPMFEEQDKEDDFNGVDHGSRDVIREVSVMINQTLRESRFMMVFINGSTDEVALTEFGILEYYGIIIWTFGRRFVTVHDIINSSSDLERLTKNLRHTGLFIFTTFNPKGLSDSQLNALFHEEVATIVARYPFMLDYDLTMFIHCCRYGFFLQRSSHSTILLDWATHASNFWMCDGIIQQEDRAREICNALDSEIILEGDDSLLDEVFPRLMQHPETSYLLIEEKDDNNVEKYENRPYRWISITSKNNIVQGNMQTILARASTIFLSFDKTVSAPKLPNALFKQCNKLGVLILSCCAFSFVSPPFLHCNTLRFLGLGNCTHQNNTNEHEGGDCITKWTFLQSLWVVDLRYTDWGEILSEEKIGLMANLTELNIKGVRCWQYTSQLHKSLPYLQRLRIIKPVHQEATSMDIDNSFVDKKQLEILDLSGNRYMKKLPASLSDASRLQILILDGCDGLEHVVLASPSLRSFSFDGYGPASNWTSNGKLPPMSSRPKSRPSAVDKKDAKASKISLEGCTLLEDLFLRGLPNLEELNLSGCAIKVLDFEAMMVDVPRLKRLFLLGCECLRAIKWGSDEQQSKLRLELICIDTWPGSGRVLGCAQPPLSLGAQQRSFRLQVHAIFEDARLARSLWAPIYHASSEDAHYYFNISITSSVACTENIQPEATKSKEMMTGSSDHQRHCNIAARDMYCDVFTKVGDGLAPMQTFPQGPTGKLDNHVEIGDGSRNVQSEADGQDNLAWLMANYAHSLHVHDVTRCSNTMPKYLRRLRWCRVERCPSLHAVFPPRAEAHNDTLKTIWASDLLMARCVWSKSPVRWSGIRFNSLEHLHLRRCPSLQFALAMALHPTFPCLKTIHIIHCGDLKHIFVAGDEDNQHTCVKFPKLTTIHLLELFQIHCKI
jgi:hypothetical protein